MAKVFFDSNLFIYLFEGHRQFGERVRSMRESMLDRKDELVTSAMAVGEVLVMPVRSGNLALVERYEAYFQGPNITVIPFDFEASRRFARIRTEPLIGRADAAHLACASVAGVDLFVTNDDRLARKIVPGVKFIASLASAPL